MRDYRVARAAEKAGVGGSAGIDYRVWRKVASDSSPDGAALAKRVASGGLWTQDRVARASGGSPECMWCGAGKEDARR
eukprot:15456033-Alexandrium_andersonii.AAC.1